MAAARSRKPAAKKTAAQRRTPAAPRKQAAGAAPAMKTENAPAPRQWRATPIFDSVVREYGNPFAGIASDDPFAS